MQTRDCDLRRILTEAISLQELSHKDLGRNVVYLLDPVKVAGRDHGSDGFYRF